MSSPSPIAKARNVVCGRQRRFMRWYRAHTHRRERRRARVAIATGRLEDAEIEAITLNAWVIS